MTSLQDADLLDPARLEVAVREAHLFHGFLTELFDGICRREELSSSPFDRRAAAEALRLYLGE
jgi:hypothetical protein